MKNMQKRLIAAAGITIMVLSFLFLIIPGRGLEAEIDTCFLKYKPYMYWDIEPGTQKAVYLTGCSASIKAKREETYKLVSETELNSIVFDVKDDWGYVAYDTEVEMAKDIGADRNYYDLDLLVEEMNTRKIYGIARFVVFKDSILPAARPEFAIADSRTGAPLYSEGSYWPDIYCEEVIDYYIELVKEVASKGVREIQFDYVRAPARGNIAYADYTYNNEDRTKVWAITNFLRRVREETRYFDIKISADVFGYVFIVDNDQGIGQMLEEMVPYLDYIYPMPYPSHYSPYFLGYENPERYPYEVVSYTLERGIERIKKVDDDEEGGNDCMVIPWIQAFGLKVNYGKEEIQSQVRAAEELGIEGYLCWNAANKYQIVEDALKSEESINLSGK